MRRIIFLPILLLFFSPLISREAPERVLAQDADVAKQDVTTSPVLDDFPQLPIVFASVNTKGDVTMYGVVTQDMIIEKQVTEGPVKGLSVANPLSNEERGEYIGRGYIRKFTKEQIQFFNLQGNEVSPEIAAKQLRGRKPVIWNEMFESSGSFFKSDTLILKLPDSPEGFPVKDWLIVDDPSVRFLDVGMFPNPPRQVSLTVHEGKLQEIVERTYTVCSPRYETRVMEIPYTITKEDGLQEERVKQVTYKVRRMFPEQRTWLFSTSHLQFDGDISNLDGTLMFPVSSDGKSVDPAYMAIFRDDTPIVSVNDVKE